jgi:hypothetical protein
MSRFTDALVVSPLADGKTWIVLRPFGYDVEKEDSGDRIEVEVGFMTDFASVPRLFWIVLPKWGKYGNAAVIHDWLYWTQERQPRRQADAIFLEAMTVLGVGAWQKYPMYWAVRAFGRLAWVRNQWDREAGYDRVLRRPSFKSGEASNRLGILNRALQRVQRPAVEPKS